MLDQFTGTVFNIPTGGNTQGMNVQNFMKTMGANQATSFTPEKPMEDLQPGLDATGAYFSALERANSFGMEMAAKNIDVFRPDSRNPQSVVAAKQMQRLMRNVQQQGNGLKVGQQMAKMYAQERLNPNVAQTAPMVNRADGSFTGPTTAEDLNNNLVNMLPVLNQVENTAKLVNTGARTVKTDAERDALNLEITDGIKEMRALKAKFVAAGFPEDQVESIIENGIAGIGKATSDPMAGEVLGIRKSELQLRKADTASKINLRKARAKKASGKKDSSQIMLRKDTIERIQNGDLDAVGALVGSKNGSWTVTDAKFTPGGDLKRGTGRKDEDGNEIFTDTGNANENTVTITSVNGSGEKRKEVIPMGESSGGAFFELNNWLNLAPGQEKFSIEDLSKDMSDFTEEEMEKEGINPTKSKKSTGSFWD